MNHGPYTSPSSSTTDSPDTAERKRTVGAVYDEGEEMPARDSKFLAVEPTVAAVSSSSSSSAIPSTITTENQSPERGNANHVSAYYSSSSGYMGTEKLPETLSDSFKVVVFKYLSNKDLAALSKVSQQFCDWTCQKREERKERKIIEVSTLLLAVVQGDESKAQEILNDTPSLLLYNIGSAVDYSGRLIQHLTPFQAALCAGDVEMCEMMNQYLSRLFPEEKDKDCYLKEQCKKIFGNDIEAFVEQQEEKANQFSSNFDIIFEAIKSASDDEVQTARNMQFNQPTNLNRALEKFRNDFAQKALFESEKVFNPYYLLNAFKKYDEKFNVLDTWDKRDLFWCQVLGYVQRFMPACYAQAFATGLYNIVDGGGPLSRQFSFHYNPSVSIFPLTPSANLGFEWACAGWRRGLMADSARRLFESYLTQKHHTFRNCSVFSSIPTRALGYNSSN